MRPKTLPWGDEARDRIYDYIAAYVTEHGFSPTVREIEQALGYSGPSTVHVHLEVLREQGRITSSPQKPRTLRVVA